MRLSIILAAAIATASLGPAHAALGGSAGSLPAEARAMRATSYAATPVSVNASSFHRHDLQLIDGGRATEFSDPSGHVFAVSWQSPTMPDLDALLGAHRASLDKAQKPSRLMGRAPRQISATDADCVLVSTGHLRDYRGYAYLASRLPADFDVKDLSK